ncbi:hypothetical protein A2363_01460 [Candidatus Gottesmanbacteria bacterium RIFOXYB1_FULL_47_11]|uniref:Uncharacterized protein n=1 Tax=Candidatus Gottesmanbacteria bacterium RIFOXYB1_FULL_47_11 TaxID=1798401 RepID=A0A1F6BE46_9BACT|nr:MAG: hypothetical protein A2363_01460 [Candidatus Gottesmanbacteria bacterium RIFOXYB1_FULL_47_11]
MRTNKELTANVVNFVLRKTLGQLDVAMQYRIAGRFGFRVSEKNWPPAYPEYHLSEQKPPDNAMATPPIEE